MATLLRDRQRAYAVLSIKSVDDEQRIIEGIASTPTLDRQGDAVDPKGATFTLPLPLLWQHRADQPIGQVISAIASLDGIAIRAQIAKGVAPFIDEAWALIKAGLVRGLSIGAIPTKTEPIKGTFFERWLEWSWLELSAVTLPANADASIQTIKSYDTTPPGALAIRGSVALLSGASDFTRAAARQDFRAMKKTYADQIHDLEATRAAKAAKLDEIQSKASDENRTKDESEKQEFDDLSAEIKGIDAELTDLQSLEAISKAAAVPVTGMTVKDASAARGGHAVIRVEQKLAPGIGFARYAACKAASAIEMRNGNFVSPLDLAKARYPDDSALRAIFEKTTIPAGTTYGSHWADDLVPYQVLQSDFIEYLRPSTIIGQFGQNGVPSLRRVPFNIRVGGLSAGTTGYWKGEGKPIPVSKATTENITLTWAHVTGLTVLTQELVRHSTPSAEEAIRNDLAAAVTARMDIDFVDPSKAAVSNTSPASITYGIVATAPTGTAAINVRHDLAVMLAAFATANLGRSNLVLIMSDTMLGNIAMMINALGNPSFPELDLGAATPRLQGIPIIASEHLTGVGSPSTQTIVLVKADEVYLADEGNVTVDVSNEASIEMLDSALQQDATNATGASLVNMWQVGAIALRAQREINWKLRRATAVHYISPAAYAVPTS